MPSSDQASTSRLPPISPETLASYETDPLGTGRASSTLGWVPPPPALELVQVHYIARHGQRTPVRARLQNSKPPIPSVWNMCHAGRQFSTAVVDLVGPAGSASNAKGKMAVRGGANGEDDASFNPGRMEIRKRTERADSKDRPVAGQEGDCLLGELTDLGRASTNALGKALRNVYIDQARLLPSKLTEADRDSVYFRSTNMGRTIESLQSIIRGLLPETASGDFVPDLLIRDGSVENLLPNTFGCARLRHLDAHFAATAAALHNPRLQTLDDLIAPHCDGRPPRVDGHPRINGVLDTIRAAQAHALPVPAPFHDKQTVSIVEAAVVDEWFSGYSAPDAKARDQYRRLAMGRFVNDLSDRMLSKARKGDEEPLKLAVYSAHDTSLAGILSTLEVYDRRWPAFTASMGVELFKGREEASKSVKGGVLSSLGLGGSVSKGGAGAHYVRLRYGDRTLRLPGCAQEGSHLPGSPDFCTLEAFVRIADSMRHPQGKSWEQECEEGRGDRSSK